MCANIKELLLYYQAALLRIFSRHDKKERLLETLGKVRPVAVLIAKVSKLCELYKENGCAFREGNTILTRIYNEAIKVTDPKVALVFYSLLKACCEVYFRYVRHPLLLCCAVCRISIRLFAGFYRNGCSREYATISMENL